jgi:hypothetical protein
LPGSRSDHSLCHLLPNRQPDSPPDSAKRQAQAKKSTDMKASELIEKARQRRQDGEAIKTYWADVLPNCGAVPEEHLNSWLGTFDFDTIVAGIDATVIQRSKRKAQHDLGKGEPMTPAQTVLYASATMRNLRYKSLPDEEREAIAERKAAISAARSAAGKKGNEVRWSQPKVATVWDDLRSDATVLRTTLTGTGSGSSSFSSTCTATLTDSPTEKAKAKAALPKKEESQTPKPKTNPAGASGLSANQDQNQPQEKSAPAPVKYSRRNCPKCDEPMHRDENHVCKPKCTCYAVDFGDTEHRSDCAITIQARIAQYGSPLGNVDQL